MDIAHTAISGALGGAPQLWSDIAILIPKPWPAWWGASAPANGSDEQRAASLLIGLWKGAHNRCVALKVLDGLTWDVSGIHWDDGSHWDTGTVTVWTPPSN